MSNEGAKYIVFNVASSLSDLVERVELFRT